MFAQEYLDIRIVKCSWRNDYTYGNCVCGGIPLDGISAATPGFPEIKTKFYIRIKKLSDKTEIERQFARRRSGKIRNVFGKFFVQLKFHRI